MSNSEIVSVGAHPTLPLCVPSLFSLSGHSGLSPVV